MEQWTCETFTFLSLKLYVSLGDGLGPVTDGVENTLEQFPTMFRVAVRSTDRHWQWTYTDHARTYTHTTILQPSWILSGTTQVSWQQKGKSNLDLLEQEIVSGSGISWAICKPASWPRHITTPASHHSVFNRQDALPATQPTASKHWRHTLINEWQTWQC